MSSGKVRQTGIVLEVEGEMATVRFARSDACGRCNACFAMGKKEADISITNTVGAQPGDMVVIELHGSSVFKASLIMYGVPLVALVAGVALGSILGDFYAAGAGVLFAVGSFFILRALEPKFSRMGEFKPRMVEIVEQSELVSNQKKGEGEDG